MERALAEKRDALLAFIGQFESCGVAYSGGVDSAVVALAAQQVLGSRATAVTGVSPSLARSELTAATELAEQIGISHQLIETSEFEQPEYVRNAADRCFHCKTELYGLMQSMASQSSFEVVLNGVNVDDLGDYRPGLAAAADFGVRSPLAECEISKQEVRQLALAWDLPVWDKPASPCLSSRVAYGESVTPERLAMIDQAEEWLRARGFREVRVRYHRGEVARLEVPAVELARVVESPLREQLIEQLTGVGFKFVALDLQGFRSGSLNQLLESDDLVQLGDIEASDTA